MGLNYRATATLTYTSLASLASSAGLTGVAESAGYDNTTNKDPGGHLAGVIKAGTSPTAGQIYVWVAGLLSDAPVWPDVLDGTDSAETFTSANIRNAVVRQVAILEVDTTTDRVYPFGPVDISLHFGGVLPQRFVVVTAHNTVAALNASGHAVYFTPYYFS